MDITYLLFLQKIREATGGIFDGIMLQLTELAEPTITFLVFAAVYWCINKRAGQFMGF